MNTSSSSFGSSSSSSSIGNSISATIHLGFYSNVSSTIASTITTTDNVRLAHPVSLDMDGDDISEALIVPYPQTTTTTETQSTNTRIIFGMQILHLKPLFTSTSYNNHHSNTKPFFIPSRMMESVISYIPQNDNNDDSNNEKENKYTMIIALKVRDPRVVKHVKK